MSIFLKKRTKLILIALVLIASPVKIWAQCDKFPRYLKECKKFQCEHVDTVLKIFGVDKNRCRVEFHKPTKEVTVCNFKTSDLGVVSQDIKKELGAKSIGFTMEYGGPAKKTINGQPIEPGLLDKLLNDGKTCKNSFGDLLGKCQHIPKMLEKCSRFSCKYKTKMPFTGLEGFVTRTILGIKNGKCEFEQIESTLDEKKFKKMKCLLPKKILKTVSSAFKYDIWWPEYADIMYDYTEPYSDICQKSSIQNNPQ